MNPFFGGKMPFNGMSNINSMMGGMRSPFQNIQQIMQNINMIRQNPNQMGTFLYNQKAINKQQLDEIQRLGIGGNPEAIGNYLMNHGAFTQQQAEETYQNSALPIQNSMKQN